MAQKQKFSMEDIKGRTSAKVPVENYMAVFSTTTSPLVSYEKNNVLPTSLLPAMYAACAAWTTSVRNVLVQENTEAGQRLKLEGKIALLISRMCEAADSQMDYNMKTNVVSGATRMLDTADFAFSTGLSSGVAAVVDFDVNKTADLCEDLLENVNYHDLVAAMQTHRGTEATVRRASRNLKKKAVK